MQERRPGREEESVAMGYPATILLVSLFRLLLLHFV